MTRFLAPLAPLAAAARRARFGDPLGIRSAAPVSQCDLPAAAAPSGRARLTNFRRAIQG